MSSLAKTNTLAIPDSLGIKNTLQPRTVYYLPVNTRTKIREEQKNTSSTKQDTPIDKWIMPVQPQGYLLAKQHDIF